VWKVSDIHHNIRLSIRMWPTGKSVLSECGRLVIQSPLGSSQRLKKWHLLLPG